jgi:hypothetical protein
MVGDEEIGGAELGGFGEVADDGVADDRVFGKETDFGAVLVGFGDQEVGGSG